MELLHVLVSYPNDGRGLKRFITTLLKSGAAHQVQRFNYVKSYTLKDGKVQQEEEKILLIKTTSEKLTKLHDMINKNHPYKVLNEKEYVYMLSGGE